MNDRSVLVIVELEKGNALAPASLECLTAGRIVAEAWNARLNALLIGQGIGEAAASLRFYNLDDIFTVDGERFRNFEGELHADIVAQVCQMTHPELILMGSTFNAVELAPRVGYALDAGVLTSCAGVEIQNQEAIFLKAVYSSNVMARYSFAASPYIVMMASRAYDAPPKAEDQKGAVVAFDVTIDESKIKTNIIERQTSGGEEVNLAAADIIVAGGRGIGGKEGFEELKQLADALGGTVGASRPPCDLGWISPKTQVGQTGSVVAPRLYVAVGISGTMQHLAGMSGSKKIVSINKDPNANIFKVSDYGIVGKYEEVVPALRKAISELGR